MDNLNQLIKIFLNEGVMDNLTTELSRDVVNHIKKNLGKGSIPHFFKSINGLFIRIIFVPSNSHLHADAGSFNDETNILAVRVYYSPNFKSSEISKFIPSFKEVVRHELEHFRQSQRRSSGKSKSKTGNHYNPFTAVYGDYPNKEETELNHQDYRAYYLHPNEIEAHVMGAYKEAKTRKIPLSRVLSEKIREIYSILINRGLYSGFVEQLVMDIREAWIEYIQVRLSHLVNKSSQDYQTTATAQGEFVS